MSLKIGTQIGVGVFSKIAGVCFRYLRRGYNQYTMRELPWEGGLLALIIRRYKKSMPMNQLWTDPTQLSLRYHVIPSQNTSLTTQYNFALLWIFSGSKDNFLTNLRVRLSGQRGLIWRIFNCQPNHLSCANFWFWRKKTWLQTLLCHMLFVISLR